ncbi:hypothetical protein [Microcoleus sp. D3_18a_C4]|uniref:hypothetical protein n=1 Tax=unclassified Microcoleus TaxID=2642155 RepID=UPI002FD01614
MNQKILDLIVGILATISAVASFSFWLASRQIRDDVFHQVDKISDTLKQRMEVDLMKLDYKLQRWQDYNKMKDLTLESRIERIEERIFSTNKIVDTINEGFSTFESDNS